MRTAEHLILLGETMMILMSISGKLYSQVCRTPTVSIFSSTLSLLCRSRHCFKLGWPWRTNSSFFLEPTPRSKVLRLALGSIMCA